MDDRRRGFVALLVSAVMGMIAFVLVLTITDPPGPGLDPDALQYLGAASSMAAAGEYTVPLAPWKSADSTEPLTHFPPGYPTALALPVRMGMEPAQAARLVDASAAFISTATVVLLVSTAASPVVGALLALSLFAMTAMYTAHASVLSEPLFLACLSLTLAAMVITPDRPVRAGIPAALALMTRYAGLSIVGAIGIWALMRPGRWTERFKRATIAVAPALVLQIVWVLRTRAVAVVSDIRKIALYGKWSKTLQQGGTTFAAWLIPDAAADHDPLAHRAMLAVAAALALAGLCAIGAWHLSRAESGRERNAGRASRLIKACALLLACYAALLGASRLFADPGIPFDERIFAPALLLLMIIAATTLSFWWRGTRLRNARRVVAAALLAWWCAALAATHVNAHFAMTWGSDFAGQQWRESEVLAWGRNQGYGAPIYSNWPAAIFFYLRRPSHELPKLTEHASLKAFGDTVRAHGGHVLLFTARSEDYVANALLIKTSGLDVIEELDDGWILGVDH
ncbi:MAG: glycosyltransferase family 39 protein [Gemmatimonadota bacterium]|nr:glycosyltransferase family 39 protein [Gemmatimonadota bacterium]